MGTWRKACGGPACRNFRASTIGTRGWTPASARRPNCAPPFKDAVRITEAVLLTVKATRFPGQELLWDKSKLAFSNHAQATQTIVRRDYRNGFAPPRVG